MKVEDIEEMMNEDRKIDKLDLENEIFKTALLHGKYYHIMMEESRILKTLQLLFAKLKLEKTNYYLGKSDDEVYIKNPLNLRVTKQELDLYLDQDEEMQKTDFKVFNQKMKVQMLHDFISNIINTRGYYIKDYISYEKFKSGIN